MMNELKFKTGKFISDYKRYTKKGRDGEKHVYASVQKRKLALSSQVQTVLIGATLIRKIPLFCLIQ